MRGSLGDSLEKEDRTGMDEGHFKGVHRGDHSVEPRGFPDEHYVAVTAENVFVLGKRGPIKMAPSEPSVIWGKESGTTEPLPGGANAAQR